MQAGVLGGGGAGGSAARFAMTRLNEFERFDRLKANRTSNRDDCLHVRIDSVDDRLVHDRLVSPRANRFGARSPQCESIRCFIPRASFFIRCPLRLPNP
eukprot:scaffold164221_cov27-Tisochrysis_lutea.AAC.2